MADNINITYDLLFDILRYEKSRDEIQTIDKDFYKNVVEYLQNKETILLNSQTPVPERELTRIQMNNVRKLLTELYERRERKIINLALYKLRTGSEMINKDILLEDEKMLFDSVFLVLDKYRQSIINNVLSNKLPFAQPMMLDMPAKQTDSTDKSRIRLDIESDLAVYSPDDKTVKSVRFIKPVPRFLGPELEIYGPFDEHDIASLPSRIANILISKSRAEEIRAE